MGPVAVLSQNRLASAGNIVGSGEKSAEVEEGFKEIVVGTHLSADPISSRGCTAAGAPNPPVGQALAASIWRQARLRGEVPHWELRDGGLSIERTFKFRNFAEALNFVQQVGELAESEGHHPDVSFGWGYATLRLQTKKIKGLHENDFILAAKIDRLNQRASA